MTSPDSLPTVPVGAPITGCLAVMTGADGKKSLTDLMDVSTLDAASLELLSTAERAFARSDLPSARTNYAAFLRRHPTSSRVMTFMGQTFVRSDSPDSVLYWYRKAVETNPTDYMAHWFYASTLVNVDSFETAVNHMITAMVLNRTNTTMHKELPEFFAKAGYQYDDWSFLPRLSLRRTSEKVIEMKVDSTRAANLAFCSCYAAWRYELDAVKGNIDTSDHIQIIFQRERECLASYLIPQADSLLQPTSSAPNVQQPLRAMNEHEFQECAFYEAVLVRSPIVAYMVDERFRSAMERYVRKYHLRKRT